MQNWALVAMTLPPYPIATPPQTYPTANTIIQMIHYVLQETPQTINYYAVAVHWDIMPKPVGLAHA
jgi:hypothetical protein